MLIVAGLTLKNVHPRVWDVTSPYYLPQLRAVMVSYSEFHARPAARRRAMDRGLHAYFGVPKGIAVYLDNGAFAFLSKGGEVPRADYEAFVAAASPDWYAIPQDYIPTPRMEDAEQLRCLERTMAVNRAYGHDGYVPVVHAGRHLDEYLRQLLADGRLRRKPVVGLGALVPNLLRAEKAAPYQQVLDTLCRARAQLADRRLHVFGLGGTATLHVAALLGIDSLDSSGWRNRAARGIVQLPGRGDRAVASLGSWRGRQPSDEEWGLLGACPCPACTRFGIEGLRGGGIAGFCNRATHNLWTLLREAEQAEARLADGSYDGWYPSHLNNSVYLPLVRRLRHQLVTPDPPSAV
jgi:7-cyano-7-deazaguanine tRNA-ribosyltransferase